jgi:arylformamidase
MKIYDISQGVFGCQVYPGDPTPKKEIISDIEKGDLYNLTAFYMCAHNGTHVDAPSHFIKGGKTVGEIPLYKTAGLAYLAQFDGILGEKDALNILEKAKSANVDSSKRIIIKGDCTISAQGAEIFAKGGIYLLGNESQTIGPADSPMEVHLILLKKEIVLLEGIRLSNVPEGVYLLNATPLLLDGCDGAPCRAILMEI